MMSAGEVRGTPVGKASTSCDAAWLGSYRTIRLDNDLRVIRVHMGAGEGAATRKDLVSGAGAVGRWYAAGDFVLSRSDYIESRSLPAGGFTEVDMCILRAGSRVNVGRCSAMFGHAGGGEQIELVSGPPPARIETGGNWVDEYGHA